jgi:AraC family transcriptional regulator
MSVGATYPSYLAYYTDRYGHTIREARPAGRSGATMMLVEQSAGDWSDAATPDLIVSVLIRHELTSTLDLGAGRTRRTYRGPNAFVVVPPNSAPTFLAEGVHELRLIAIPFAGLLALVGPDARLPPDGDFGRLHATGQDSPAMGQLMARLWKESASGCDHGGLWADGSLLQLAALLLRLSQGAGPRLAAGGLAPWQERRVVEAMQDSPERSFDLHALARLAKLSPFHFARAFRHSTGLPPHAYLRRLRCERAKDLLTGSGLPVTEIAARVGYETPQAFARMFRAEVGASPTEYRRARRS